MPEQMTTRSRVGASVATIGLAAAAVAVLAPGPEAAGSQTPPIGVEVLAPPSAFPDDVSARFRRQLPGSRREVLRMADPGNIVVARITLQPGARFPWHTHPGPVVVSVVSGELVYQQASDCVERDYAAGQAFLDPGNRVHTAWNGGGQQTVLVATFHDVPEGSTQVTIPTADQSDRCD